MGLREHVLPVELAEDLLDGFRVRMARQRPGHELFMVLGEHFFIVPPAEGAAEAVGLAGGKAGDIYGKLVDLVLEKDNAERPF